MYELTTLAFWETDVPIKFKKKDSDFSYFWNLVKSFEILQIGFDIRDQINKLIRARMEELTVQKFHWCYDI